MLRCNLKHLILLLSVFHHKVHLITLVFYGFQLDIEQWGQVGTGHNGNVTLNISVSRNNYFAIVTPFNHNANLYQMSIITRTTNNFTFRNYHNDSSYLWFVAAQRLQWGKAGGYGQSISFPIAYRSAAWIVLTFPAVDSDRYTNGGVTSLSKTAFNTAADGDSNKAFYWISCGKQLQWGQAKTISSVRTKKFAITFPSECIIAMALPWKDDDLAYQINIQSVELSSFKYYYYNARAEFEICYIAFGV